LVAVAGFWVVVVVLMALVVLVGLAALLAWFALGAGGDLGQGAVRRHAAGLEHHAAFQVALERPGLMQDNQAGQAVLGAQGGDQGGG
jgi:hypothetical protein